MNILITRIHKTTDCIDGLVSIDGIHICDCAENAISAIQAGTYPVEIIKCIQHSRKMPIALVEGVGCRDEGNSLNSKPYTLNHLCENCSKLEFVNNNTKMPVFCPQIKAGNGVYHREDGTIIVGRHIAPGCLSKSKEAFDNLYDRIRKTIERGKEVTLTIRENYPLLKQEHHSVSIDSLSNFEFGTFVINKF